jgi:hypothetical protein
MAAAVLEGNWSAVAEVSVQTAQKLNSVQVSNKARVGNPWLGAFTRLKTG